MFSFNAANGQFSNLHNFTGQNGDGSYPSAKLALLGNMLYGTTEQGGTWGYGTVFEINTTNDSYQILHTFSGTANGDGENPDAAILVSGGVLYGTTTGGGTNATGQGTVFSIDLNDTNRYSILHSFGSRRNDGIEPEGALVISGSALYGTTEYGGTNGYGIIFSVSTGGAGYTDLHSFNDDTNDGAFPVAGLSLSGSTLYGTSESGGSSGTNGSDGFGVVFCINTSGGGFTNLYSFQDDADGAYPETALVGSGNTLFGTTSGDPDSANNPNYGTIFSIKTDGSDFTILETFSTNGLAVLHRFSGPDGSNPCSQLALSGSTFYNIFTTVYGTTVNGGTNGYGTVFKVNTDGTGFADLYEFAGTNDGRYPRTGLLIDGNVLYGTTTNSIFKINTDGSDFTCLTNITDVSQLILSPSGNTLYGTISNGGVGYGSIFSINTDGSGFTNFYSFPGGGAYGEYPASGLELYSDYNAVANHGSTVCTLYGTTFGGGSNGFGTVFSIDTDGSNFMDLHDFDWTNDGAYPAGGLVITNDNENTLSLNNSETYLYGTASTGGANGGGTIFGVDILSRPPIFRTLYSFSTNGIGDHPEGKLAFTGSTLFGTTANGGAYTNGTVYSIGYNGTNYVSLYNFGGGSDGGTPLAGLTLPVVDNPKSVWSLDTTINVSAANLASIRYSIGIDNYYALFVNGTLAAYTNEAFNAVWSPYSSLAPFLHPGTNDLRVIIASDDDGFDYFSMVIRASLTNTLFGTTYGGGVSNDGTIFELSPEGYEIDLHNFIGLPDGQNPVGGLVLSGTNLYGVTQDGGTNGYGEIFRVSTNGSAYLNLYSFAGGPDGAYPLAGLTLAGNTLYGTTSQGGTNNPSATGNNGTIFRISTDGSDYANLYSFAGPSYNDGRSPEAPLLLVGTNLYGTASSGGTNYGTIFSICTNGYYYQTLYSFAGPPNDGFDPQGRLAVSGNILYGTTFGFDPWNGAPNGTIFSFAIGGSNAVTLYTFTNTPDGANPQGGVTLSGNTLYGTTYNGGAHGVGTIFSIGVGGNGDGYKILQSFDSSFNSAADSYSGQNPQSDLNILGNLLYGTTSQSGANGVGTVFCINTNGADFNDVYDFSNSPYGASPEGGVCSP